ncbi:unnamed protein product [Prorocentrum cordatum]|uniref:Uncharacterized protein n=1 Tax=Prorocentrum cordatum TaxID=2364126 RepID=A0ABN9XPD4_9DINO|nr:unnamed protein product [Polarella glacialis]
MVSGPVELWSLYLRRLERRPVPTKCCTSFWMFLVSQLLAQCIADGRVTSFRRMFDFCFWGSIIPIGSHRWQNFLAAHGPTNMLVKIPFDHVMYRTPILVVFHIYIKLMQNMSFGQALKWTLQNNPKVQITSAKLWPVANIANYLFVPLPLRVLYQNVVLFFWVLYLSYKTAGDKKQDSWHEGNGSSLD